MKRSDKTARAVFFLTFSPNGNFEMFLKQQVILDKVFYLILTFKSLAKRIETGVSGQQDIGATSTAPNIFSSTSGARYMGTADTGNAIFRES